MVTETRQKSGYWRKNPETGEAEWIEGQLIPPEIEPIPVPAPTPKIDVAKALESFDISFGGKVVPPTALPAPTEVAPEESPITTLFRRVFLSSGLSARQRFPIFQTETEFLSDIDKRVRENPNKFLEDLRLRGRTEDTVQVLRMFSAESLTEEMVGNFFQGQPEITPQQNLLMKALPLIVRPTTIAWATKYFGDKPDALRRNLITAGRNPDTEALVKSLYPQITDRGLEDYFSARVPKISKPEAKEATLFDAAKVLGKAITKVPKQLGASILQVIQGQGGASIVNKDWADRFIEDASKDIEKFTQEVSDKYRESSFPIKLTDIAQLPQNIAYSLTSMGAGITAGVPVALAPIPGARIAAWGIGSAASGAVAYSMTTYQIMQQYLEAKNDESIAKTGKGITAEEEKQLKDDFDSKAREYGLWEAVPEAISNLAFAKILTLPLTKIAGRAIATRIVGKLIGLYGEELLTETITQKGQSDIEVEAGLREGKIDWVEAFKEVAPQTFLLTTILGGVGQVGVLAVNKAKESLRGEIGEKHPLYKTIEGRLKEALAEEKGAIEIPGEKPAITPEGVKPEVPAVPEKVTPVAPEVTGKLNPSLVEKWHSTDPSKGIEHGRLGTVGDIITDPKALKQFEKIKDVEIYTADLLPRGAWGEHHTNIGGKSVIYIDPRATEKTLWEEIIHADRWAKGRPMGKGAGEPSAKIGREHFTPVEPAIPKTRAEIQASERLTEAEMFEKGAIAEREAREAIPKAEAVPEAEVAHKMPAKLLRALNKAAKEFELTSEEIAEAKLAYKEGDLSVLEKLQQTEALDDWATDAQTVLEAEATKAFLARPKPEVPAVAELPVEVAETPLPSLPEPTPEEIAINQATIGQPTLTPAQVTRTLELFGKYIESPSALSAWELTRELRRETRAGQAEQLKFRAQELIVSQGMDAEVAMRQAIKETLSGELPKVTTDYLSDLTDQMRNVLFNKVYQTLKEEPFEMTSTLTALTNALVGKPIPRELGVKGGSAYTRLQRVFGDQPAVMKALDKVASQKKPLENVVEGVFRDFVEGGNPPIPVDQEMAEYLRGLKTTVLYEPTVLREPISVKKFEAPIEDAFRQGQLWPRPVRDNIVRALKELGMLPVDIGNFLRANKASVDFSFWRQQAPLIVSHPISFAQANVEAGRAIWSQKSAEASWERITRDPLYQIYSEATAQGGDFLRPLMLPKGTAQWRGTEEYGYSKGVERMLPKLTAALPWVKLSARAFETGTNVHNWLIFKSYYAGMLRLAEMYASGQKKFKAGEGLDITKEMVDFSKSLANFSARGSLGKFAATAPELSGLFFAPRAAIGRILSVKDLINANPRVRLEAWKNAASFVGTFGGIILLGAAMGWWEVERDPRNAEYMSIRIGNTRIDPWGGFRQFLVFFARAITLTGVSSVTGAEYEVDPINLIQTFIRGKASPLASLILDFWRGKNFIGEKVDVADKAQWAERVAPFAVWDIYEAYKDDPIHGLQVVIPAVLGAGVQTYTGDWKENFPKLGLPKYSENLTYGLVDPKYNTADFWSDTASQFKDVDPATLTRAKGFPEYIRAIAEARVIKESLESLPSERLVSLNVDPTKGATFADYYKMWRDREALVLAGDKAEYIRNELQPDGKYKKVTYKGEDALKAFDSDERTRNANQGNFSQRQFALLNEYWLITDKKKQAEFLKQHEAEIGVKPRDEYLRTHPKENAQLAVWGQAKILTKEAYNQFKGMVKSLDIPDSALPKLTLPPETSLDTHWKYEEMVSAGTHGSWEAQLLLKKDALKAKDAKTQSYVEWRTKEGEPLKLSDSPIASLELKTEKIYRETWLKLDDKETFGKLDDKKKGADGLTDRQREIAKLKATKIGDFTYIDIDRKVDAIEKGAMDYLQKLPLPPQPKGNEWILKPDEEPSPEGLSPKKQEYRSLGLTASQYLQVIDSWFAGLPLEDKEHYLEQGRRFTEFGWIEDPMQFVRLELADVVGFKELGLTSERAHELADRLFPGLRNRVSQAVEGGGPIVQAHIDFMRIIDEPGRGSSSAEAMLFRVDNLDYNAWRMDKTIWGDKKGETLEPIDQSRIPIWRIDVKYRKEDAAYQAILDKYPKRPPEEIQEAKDYLATHEAYRKDNRRREAYGLTNSQTGEKLPLDQVESYVGYMEILDKPGVGSSSTETMLYRVNNRAFDDAMIRVKGWKPIDESKIREWRIEFQFQDLFNERQNILDTTVDTKEQNAKIQKLFAENPAFQSAYYRHAGYQLDLSEEYTENYVTYMLTPEKGWSKERYLKLHPEFYEQIKKAKGWKTDIKWGEIPSEKVETLWFEYDAIPSQLDKRQQDFRIAHPDLDAWLVLTGKVKRLATEEKRRAKLTSREKFLESIAVRQSEFEKRIAELRKKLGGL